MRVWRLTRAGRANTAFSGVGTRVAGSRWTQPGHPAVYTSESIALAVLESLVHMELRHAPPHVLIPADIPKDLAVASVTPTELPADWFQTPAPSALRAFGSKWLEGGETAVLQVPSAIVHDESNFILNPLHPDFAVIQVGEAREFGFDGRLWS